MKIGSSNDAYEVEADRMADQVVGMSESQVTTSPHLGPLVQRKCAACKEEESIQKKPLAESITPMIMKKGAVQEGGQASESLSSRIQNSSGASKMDGSTQDYMENRFGADFSDVRIHTGSEAIQMSQELDAQAFTVGNDIFFNEGKYNPISNAGKHLLAHELTHTLQQDVSQKNIRRKKESKPEQCFGNVDVPNKDCEVPDNRSKKSEPKDGGSYHIAFHIDIEAATAYDVISDYKTESEINIGHVYVEFYDNNGDRYTYGLYPKETVSPSSQTSRGFVAHPDKWHDRCKNLSLFYKVSKDTFAKALVYAQNQCKSPNDFNLSKNNCSSFAHDVAQEAGLPLPSPFIVIQWGVTEDIKGDSPNQILSSFITKEDQKKFKDDFSGDYVGEFKPDKGGMISFEEFSLDFNDQLNFHGEYSYIDQSNQEQSGEIVGETSFTQKFDASGKELSDQRIKLIYKWIQGGFGGSGYWRVKVEEKRLVGRYKSDHDKTGNGEWLMDRTE